MTRIFPKLPKPSKELKSHLEWEISNDKKCRAWLAKKPDENLVKHALEIETSRGAASRREIETRLITRLMQFERDRLLERILKRKQSKKP